MLELVFSWVYLYQHVTCSHNTGYTVNRSWWPLYPTPTYLVSLHFSLLFYLYLQLFCYSLNINDSWTGYHKTLTLLTIHIVSFWERICMHCPQSYLSLFSLPPPQSIFHRIQPFAHLLPQDLSPKNKQMEPLKRVCLQWHLWEQRWTARAWEEPRASNRDGAVPNPRPLVARSMEWRKTGNRVSLRGKMTYIDKRHNLAAGNSSEKI